LTSTITPWQILWGKLLVGFRISFVLTCFLLWPLLLAVALVDSYWTNWQSVILMFAIVVMVCISNGVIAMFCSAFAYKTAVALITTYTLILLLYSLPVAVISLLNILEISLAGAPWLGVTSPFSAIFALPLDKNLTRAGEVAANIGDLRLVGAYFVVSTVLIALMLIATVLRLRSKRMLGDE